VLQSADTKQRFASQGANAVTSTPEELAAFMREETIKWGKVIKTSGIKIDQ
jgi:tripartite-type tricarboxylate transporter receptor subunit TctC